jgi:hypothetical protein
MIPAVPASTSETEAPDVGGIAGLRAGLSVPVAHRAGAAHNFDLVSNVQDEARRTPSATSGIYKNWKGKGKGAGAGRGGGKGARRSPRNLTGGEENPIDAGGDEDEDMEDEDDEEGEPQTDPELTPPPGLTCPAA